MWFLWRGCSCNQALILQKIFCWSRGTDVTIKGFRAFLDIRRCKDLDHEISFWKYPPKDLLHQFPWSTKCLIFHPELPSGSVKGHQLQQHGIQSSKRQMANALVQEPCREKPKCGQYKPHLIIFWPSLHSHSAPRALPPAPRSQNKKQRRNQHKKSQVGCGQVQLCHPLCSSCQRKCVLSPVIIQRGQHHVWLLSKAGLLSFLIKQPSCFPFHVSHSDPG